MKQTPTRMNWEGILSYVLGMTLTAAGGAMSLPHANWKTVAIAAGSTALTCLGGCMVPTRRAK